MLKSQHTIESYYIWYALAPSLLSFSNGDKLFELHFSVSLRSNLLQSVQVLTYDVHPCTLFIPS